MNDDRPGRDVRNDGLDGDAGVGLRNGQPHAGRGDPAGHGDDRRRIARQDLTLPLRCAGGHWTDKWNPSEVSDPVGSDVSM